MGQNEFVRFSLSLQPNPILNVDRVNGCESSAYSGRMMMPSDYKKIREENIRDYGLKINKYGPAFWANLYSDQTHFIYELLQNAEDAEATEVKFRLYRDRLELEHNGRPFDEDDVRSICALAEGTKKDDLTKIGKFGVGFKSVYAHTSSPEIYSKDENSGNEEHFVVRNYVHPYSSPLKPSALGTLFVFPFDHQEKDADESFSEISKRLEDLGIRIMLFLKHIESIEYEIDEDKGIYLRQTDLVQETDFVSDITVTGQRNSHDEEERWLVFEKDVTHLAGSISEGGRLDVQIAFQYTDDDSQNRPIIQKLAQSYLTVFFPTKENTNLGFLVQGPYKTTLSRETIPNDDDFNIALSEQTGDLVVEALRWLRDRNWLTVDVLTMMPLAYMETQYGYSWERNKYKNTLFEPIYDKVLAAVKDEALIPAYKEGYVSGNNAKLARGQALCELLDDTRLGQFFNTDEQLRWASDEITENRTSELRKYLIDEDQLDIEEIDAEKFAGRIGEDFLECQSDDWMREFYEFASGFGISYRRDNPFNILKSKPIIRLEDGRHVVPFQYGEPQAYLPTEHDSQFHNTVKREVCNSDKAMVFLEKNLELRKPDIVDEVKELILRKYEQDNEIGIEEHKKDIVYIVKALNEVPRDREDELIQDLKQTPFLLATNAANDAKESRCPDELYRRTPELEMYFEGNPEVWFLSSEYASYTDDFEEIGVASQVRVSCKSPGYGHGHVVIEDWHGWHVRGLYGFDPGCSFDGLEFALSQPNIPRSKYIWERLLIPYKHSIKGGVESCPRQTFIGSEVEWKYSIMGELVREMAWLPNKHGKFVVPKTITLDELPDGFSKDKQLAAKLEMRTSDQAFYAEIQDRDDVPENIKQIFKIPGIIDLFAKHPEKVARIVEKIEEIESKQGGEPDDSGDFNSGVYGAFNHGEQKPNPEPSIDPPKHPNYGPRGEQGEDGETTWREIDKRWRLKLGTERVKDPKIRGFLREEYHGHCQICNYTLQKRSGPPYFEAAYLVSNEEGKRIDNPGNTLCLCPNHFAEFKYGTIEAPNIFDQIKSYQDGQAHYIEVQLCNEPKSIRYTQNHIVMLKELVEAFDLSGLPQP